MPYPGVPASLTKKMERCVARVKAQGRKVNPYAVCHASIMGKRKKKSAEYNRRAAAREK
jgi:hypothetical protein